MTWSRTLVIFTTLALAASPARADYADDAAVGLKMAKGVVDRTRRAFAVGPQVGYVGGVGTDGNGLRGLSFGVAMYTFKIPTMFDLQELVAARIRIRVEERVKQIIATGGAAPTDLSEIAREVAADVKDEILGEPIKPRLLERPSLKVLFETVLLHTDGFQLRFGMAKGVRHLSFGVMGALQRAGGETTPIVGGELSLHLTPIGRAWTPVLDLYTRVDVAIAGSDTTTLFLLGGRAMLDLL